MKFLGTALAALLLPLGSPVFAQACEASFSKKGNPLTGLRFSASTVVDDLAVPDAVNQLRGLVVARGYDVLAIEPEAGDLLLEQSQSADRRSFPLVAKVTREGGVTTVLLRATLRAGVFTNTDSARVEMCGILGTLKAGKAGVAAAAEGQQAESNAVPTALSAQIFADRLSKERDKNANEIPLRYKNKRFTLSGTVAQVLRDGDSYSVVFDIVPWERKVVRLPGDSQFKTEIVCVLAPGQSVFALTLKPRSKVTLTGAFLEYRQSPSYFWLNECRPPS